MTPLAMVLVFKIVVTFVGVLVPMLVVSPARLERLCGVGPMALVPARLYAAALAALLVGYGFGLVGATTGRLPWGVVAMGLVSNGGAAAVLLGLGTSARHRGAGVLFGLIGAALAAALLWPEWFVTPLF